MADDMTPSAFRAVMDAEMRQAAIEMRDSFNRMVFGPPWLYRDRNPMPKIVVWERLADAQRWWLRNVKRRRRLIEQRVGDAWDVLRYGLPDTYED